ncbi:radical SAM [Fusibacter sp. 3D3]|nr:radical SAM [Fusibacter sp. 3D3]
MHGLPLSEHGFISNSGYMRFDTYKKIIDNLKYFNKKIKMLRFAGIGEPLLHKDIDKMISYAKKKKIADNIELVTNGLLLDYNLSKKLISSGLDKLRISIQGVTAKKYLELCKTKIDYDNFLSELEWLYNSKGNMQIYIKIIDCALENETDESSFYKMFGDKSDFIAIEHMTPTVQGIDYVGLSKENVTELGQNGSELLDSNICPQPFYLIQVNPDGNVVPCCSTQYPIILGNVNNTDLKAIWDSARANQFRTDMLEGVKFASKVCSKCNLYQYGLFKEDRLDEYSNILKEKYKWAK